MIIYLTLLFPILLFGYWFYKKPTSLLTGLLFLIFLGSLSLLIFIGLEQLNEPLAYLFAIPIAILLLALALFGVYAMIIALFWNEQILLKHERLSLANLLPLIIATALILLEVTLFFVNQKISNTWILKTFSFVNFLFFYFSLLFILFGLTAILYNLFPIKGKVDYIIVLGAGLNKDQVTPLLAARINAAIKLYNKQVSQLNHHPTLILSGGQGDDEDLSEAQAMKNYINQQGYEVAKIYLEAKSTNTKENLLFSNQVAIAQDGIPSLATRYVVIATNNYHLLRAGKLAKEQGISARGVGAPTRLYYLPTAFIREYIGYLVMTKRKHLMVIGGLLILSLIPLLFP